MKELIGNAVVHLKRIGCFCLIIAGAALCIQREALERQAVDSTVEPKTLELQEDRYPYANDRMVYIPLEHGKLEQWTLDGLYQQKVTLPVGDDWEADGLLWVDNREIIWRDYPKDGEGDMEIVYSTPIERKQGKETLLPEQTRKLFVCKEDAIRGSYLDDYSYHRGVYVNDSYIVYNADGELLFYDRNKGGKFKTPANANGYVDIPRSVYLTSEIFGDRILCHSGSVAGTLQDDLYGFWSYRLGDKELQKIDGRCFTQAAYIADPVGNKAYYQIAAEQSIWEYDFQTGQSREFLSEKKFRACFEKNGLLWDDAYYNDSLFVDDGRLYLIKDRDNPQIFSMALAKADCRYERELTEAVQSCGYSDGWQTDNPNSYEFRDYLGHYLIMLEGKILLYWQEEEEEEQYFVCIDRETAKQKIVTQKDAEKIYFGLIGLWTEPGSTGDGNPLNKKAQQTMMPEEKKDFAGEQPVSPEEKMDSAGNQPVSPEEKKNIAGEQPVSPEEQLACISRYAALWLQKEYGDDLTQYYAVTDLDHNGRLEIITTSGPQGSGAFSYNNYYQVSADGKSLRRIATVIGDIDILNQRQTVYIDRKSDTYYYLASDYVSGGSGARYCWYGAVVLENGMLTSRTYAEIGTKLSKKGKEEVWYGYSYQDGKEQKIKEEEFDSRELADRFFDGLEKEQVHFSWFRIPGKKKASEEKILQKVTQSYRDFMQK